MVNHQYKYQLYLYLLGQHQLNFYHPKLLKDSLLHQQHLQIEVLVLLGRTLQELMETGMNTAEVARQLKIARSSVYRVMEREIG